MSSNNLDTLQSITDLQNLEKQLFTNLEALTSSSNPSIEEQTAIIEKINNLSQTRVNMFNSLSSLYNTSQNEVTKSRQELMDKIVVAKVMENQLNNMKTIMNEVQDIKNNKLRMVEINTYHSKRYQAHTDLMKLIIKICVVLFILIFINKRQILPTSIINPLMLVVVGLGLFFIIREVLDLSTRDNMDYDKYEYPAMDKEDIAKRKTYDYNKVFTGFGALDSWSICGEGTEFNHSKNQCLVKPAEVNPVETFTNLSGIGYQKLTGYRSGPKSLEDDDDIM
jgi:uncharacterized protein YnzC (UPF0291/DUF896 family)